MKAQSQEAGMSEAPEHIWAWKEFQSWIAGTWGLSRYPHNAMRYRRADLPPTLSAAMELPEVRALVVALEYGDRMCRLDFHREINPDDECFSQAVWDTWQRMVAALAAIKEPKT